MNTEEDEKIDVRLKLTPEQKARLDIAAARLRARGRGPEPGRPSQSAVVANLIDTYLPPVEAARSIAG